MADIICAKCAEPWDAYGVRNGDMKILEAERFKKGEGCPCCRFGTACSSCDGSGRETGPYPSCDTCRDKGYVLAWQPRVSIPGFRNDKLYSGYSPNVITLPYNTMESKTTLGVRTFPEKAGSHQSRDGWVDEWWVICPNGCAEEKEDTCILPCDVCEGSGKLQENEDLEIEAARSEMNASDEDGHDILERRGLL
jgi:hypothetical protein